MNTNVIKKSLAVAASLTVVGVIAANPAAAQDHGPGGVETPLPGHIYFLNKPINLDTATRADYQAATTTAQDPRLGDWQSIVTDTACPADSLGAAAIVRAGLPSVPVQNWEEAALTEVVTTEDNEGRVYDIAGNAGISQPGIVDFIKANPSVTTVQVGFVCYDSNAMEQGVISTTIPVTVSANGLSLNWTQAVPQGQPSTTTVSASAQTINAGDTVTLTANVAPAGATGTVSFTVGGTEIASAPVAADGSAKSSPVAIPGVGAQTVTATYSGDATYDTSSATTTVTVNVAPRATTTTLAVTAPAGNVAYGATTLTATVASTEGTPAGKVQFVDGSDVLGTVTVANGVASLTTNGLGEGSHSIVAKFVGTAPYTDSESAASTLDLSAPAVLPAQANATVKIPAGALTITTPYTMVADGTPIDLGTAVLDEATSTFSAHADVAGIRVNDTRAGSMGFTAQVQAGDWGGFDSQYANFTGVKANQVSGNALQATDVAVTDNNDLRTAKTFGAYPAGKGVGTVDFSGVFSLTNVPTSVSAGVHTALVTFTAF